MTGRPTEARAVCNALWIGRALGPLERACLSSFREMGHPVRLHAYDEVTGVPEGVEVADASAVLPREAIVRHRRTGSVSLFSNRFRYEVLRAGAGLWIDCDVLCLRPLPEAAFLFGRQDEATINGAVLRIPHGHPVLLDLLDIFEDPRWVPPWAPLHRRLRYALRHRVQRGFGLADMSWGTTGPRALTHHLARHGLSGRALPVDAFYPVAFHETHLLAAADASAVRARLTDGTLCVHLWNQRLERQGTRGEKGSFLAAVADGSWRRVLDSDRLEGAGVP